MFSNGGNVWDVFCDVIVISQIFLDLYFYLGSKEKVIFCFCFHQSTRRRQRPPKELRGGSLLGRTFVPRKLLSVSEDNFDCCNRGLGIQRREVNAVLNTLRYRGQPFNRTIPVHVSAASGLIREDAVVEKRTG